MKIFEWGQSMSKTKNPAKVKWIYENHNKELSEAVYLENMQRLRQYSTATKKYKFYGKNQLKRQYKNLRYTFGFFTGNKVETHE